MSGYDDRRAAHVARWGELLGDRLERLRWSPDAIAVERQAALRGLVATAKERSPWHAERLAGIDADSLHPDDLTALPTMTKADLMANFDAIVTDPRVTLAAAEAHLAELDDDRYFLDDLHVVASGGSSGERGVFVYGWDAWVDVHLGLGRRIIDDLFSAPPAEGLARMGLVTAANATHMTTAVASTFASPAVEIHPFPVTLPLEEIVAGLNAVQPATLTAYASMLGVLAGEAAAGRLRITPRRIVATSEPLLPEVRSAAEETLGAPVANCWGTSEGGVLAVGCWQSSGMHLNDDLVIIEPVDVEGRPVPAGERSDKVLLTNLFNPVQPLIRYELTDEVVLLDEPCPCGSPNRRVADVHGRRDDLFRFGTAAVHPHVVRTALAKHPLVVEYQVRQTPHGVEVDVAGPAGSVIAVDLVAEDVLAGLRAAGIEAPQVAVRQVDGLARHPVTGKLCRFVPLRVG